MDTKDCKNSILNEHEAAAYIGLTYDALRLKRTRGHKSGKFPIPFKKVIGAIRYDVADLDAYLKSVTYTPKGEEK